MDARWGSVDARWGRKRRAQAGSEKGENVRRLLTVLATMTAALLAVPGALATHNPNNDVDLDAEHFAPLIWSDPIPVLNLYWETDWNGRAGHGDVSRAAIDGALEDVIDSGYLDPLDEYGVPSFDFAGSTQTRTDDNFCADEPAAQVSTAELLLFVECELLFHPLIDDAPAPRIVNLFVPAGTTIVDEIGFELDGDEFRIGRVSCVDYLAYHAFTPSHFLTIIPVGCDPTLDAVTAFLTHELIEAATDPVPLGFWIDIGSVPADIWDFLVRVPGLAAAIPQLLVAGEVADICEISFDTGAAGVIGFGSVPLGSDPTSTIVASYWSNELNACVLGEDRVVATVFTAQDVPEGAGAVEIGGIEHALPYAQMLREGTEYEFLRELDGSGHRFEPAGCSGTVEFPAGNVTADAQRTISCAYTEQYRLTVGTSPAGAVSGNASLTETGWRTAGTTVNLTADAHVAAPSAGSRFTFDRWIGDGVSGSSVVMSVPRSVTAEYDLEHEVTFDHAGIATGTGWSLTVAGVNENGPHSTWVADGAQLTFAYPAIIDPGSGTRYVRDSVSHTSPFSVTGPVEVTASYDTEYLLELDQAGIPAGVPWSVTVDGTSAGGPFAAWYAPGTIVDFAYAGIVADPGDTETRYVLAGASEDSPLTLTGPVSVAATYGTEHRLTILASGLGGNSAGVTNGGVPLGSVSDAAPLAVWLPAGTVVDLAATDPLDGAGGVQYFLDGFAPDPSGPLAGGVTTTASYRTMAEVIGDALTSGGIKGDGLANALTVKFTNAQAAIDRGEYSAALSPLASFIDQVAAQSGKKITRALAKELTLDVAAVFHATLCKAADAGQLDAASEAAWYAYYAALVTGAGGVPKPPC